MYSPLIDNFNNLLFRKIKYSRKKHIDMYMFRIISRLLGKIDVINKDIIKFHITNFIIVIYVMFIKYHRLKEV